jgi:hypothetical protein
MYVKRERGEAYLLHERACFSIVIVLRDEREQSRHPRGHCLVFCT